MSDRLIPPNIPPWRPVKPDPDKPTTAMGADAVRMRGLFGGETEERAGQWVRIIENQAVAAERVRWAKWAKGLGYPFDFTNSDAVPDRDMLDAIASEWQSDGWDSLEEAKLDVYEEVGLRDG